jgi:hypothetical protein
MDFVELPSRSMTGKRRVSEALFFYFDSFFRFERSILGSSKMKAHSLATKLIAAALASSITAISALPAIGCTAMVFRAEDGTGIYARTMEWGASDLKSELVQVAACDGVYVGAWRRQDRHGLEESLWLCGH